MSTVFIALLDKEFPPQHSFVDGMLAQELAEVPGMRVRLCVSQGAEVRKQVVRYGCAVCLPIFKPRRSFGRLINFWIAVFFLANQIRSEKRKDNRVALFVRNDPIYLLAASLFAAKVDRLVFQSSFPHEEASGGLLKRRIAKLLYRLAGKHVDSVLAVSPIGLERLWKLFPNARDGAFIPLLSDLPFVCCEEVCEQSTRNSDTVVFVYIGTHSASRELDVVLEAVVKSFEQNINAEFLFVGGKSEEIEELLRVPGVQNLVSNGVLKFEPHVSRSEIPEILAICDVGLSLIPPNPIFREASPTKLAEYMSAGLAVLASRGVPMQEQFVKESLGGLLVDWSVDSIVDGIVRFCGDKIGLKTMKSNALVYASTELKYEKYVPILLRLIGGKFHDAIQ